MSSTSLGLFDLLGTMVGFFLTLAVFSYFFGDNFLFRVAIHIFIGVAAGYAAIVAWYNVIWPQLILPLMSKSRPEFLLVTVPLLLSVMLLFKISPRLSMLGNPAMAFLVGVGVAAAIGGSVYGTLFPQLSASINQLNVLEPGQNIATWFGKVAEGGIILLGTATTLIYFHFGTRAAPGKNPARLEIIEILGWIGQLFIAISLGVIFAGVVSASMAAFVERLYSLVEFLVPLFNF